MDVRGFKGYECFQGISLVSRDTRGFKGSDIWKISWFH